VGEGVKFQFVFATVCMKQAKIFSSTCCVKMNTINITYETFQLVERHEHTQERPH